MAKRNSTKSGEIEQWRRWKKRKENRDYPLTVNGNGYWSKKIKGEVHYFGPLSDPEGAAAEWVRVKDHLLAGLPRPSKDDEDDSGRLGTALNLFMAEKEDAVENGELSSVQFGHYLRTCKLIAKEFGKRRPIESLTENDFGRLRRILAKGCGLVGTKNKILWVRTIFKWFYDSGKIDRPVRFGSQFKIPSKKAIRRERVTSAKVRHLEADQIRLILNDGFSANRRCMRPQWKALVLMGINCGFGSSDLSTLRFNALDLKGGWHDHSRTKTGVPRRAKLWPETVEAINEYLDEREARNGLVFVNSRGNPWNVESGQNREDGIHRGFRRTLDELKLHSKGLGFYSLRHSFRTIADRAKDTPAVDKVMGHVDESMADPYRAYIEDERLEAVAEAVRRWLLFVPCPKCKEPVHIWHKAGHQCPGQADDAGEGGAT